MTTTLTPDQHLTPDQLLALVALLRDENAALKAQPARALTCKVSEKGALSVYGLGRFPVTLYRGQWERLFAAQKQITDFITTNASLLAERKPD